MKFDKKIIYTAIIILIITLFSNIFSFSYAAELNDSEILSPSVILINSDNGEILYDKNSHEKNYPASITKVMTALLVFENCQMEDTAIVSHNAIFTVPVGYTIANLQEGEELTIEQLLNALLIPSANDAANVLAEHISGSIESFAELMNKRAKELGCENTHFTNPSGIHDDNHYTTAYDMSLIAKEALKYDKFKEITCKTRYTLPVTNKYDKEDRIFNTTNELIKYNSSTASNNYYYKYAIGTKTGYTANSKYTIVGSASKNNINVTAVVMHGLIDQSTGLSQRYLDCKKLFNYAFDNYKASQVAQKGAVATQIKVSRATKETKKLNLLMQDDVYATVLNEEAGKLHLGDIKLNEKIKAPISEGQVLGTITYTIDNNQYSTNLVAEKNVERSYTFINILALLVIIFVLRFYIKVKIFSANKKRKYNSKKGLNTNYNIRKRRKKKRSKRDGSTLIRYN